MIVVTGSFVAKEGRFDEALQLSLEHVRRSRGEAGCVSHAVYRDAENPARLFFFEEWESQETLDAHFAVAGTRAFIKGLTNLAEGAPQLAIYEASRLR